MRFLLLLLLLAPVLLAQQVTVYGAGLQPPANNVAQGQNDFVVLGFLPLQTSVPIPLTFTGCTLENSPVAGTAAGSSDTVRIRLIRDDNLNLTVDTTDLVVATVNSPGFPVNMSFAAMNLQIPLASATPMPIYLVAVDVESSAAISSIYRIRLTAITTSTAVTTLGLPIDGNPQTITAPSTAEIDVQRLNVSKPRGSTDNVGGLQAGTSNTVTWTIHSTGGQALSFVGASPVYVPSASVFNCTATVTQQPVGPVAVNASTTFSVNINPSPVGQPFAFIIAINNNDPDENPYTIVVNGTATAGPGAATQLVVTTHPGNGVAGMSLTASPVVEARDSAGKLDTTFTGTVSGAITGGTGTAGAVLSGSTSVLAVGGVATFGAMSVDLPGMGYALTFTSGSLASVESAQFNVTPAPATQLVVTTQPGNAVGGVIFGTQPVIEARSAGGQLDTAFAGMVSASITPATGTPGASLFGTATVMAVGGIATFTDLSIDLASTGYTLTFSSAPLTPAVSAAFDVSSAAATQLVLAIQPGSGTGGVVILPQPIVEARSAGGQVDVSFTGNVQVAITVGTGTAGATLSGTTTVAAVAGVATFTDLVIDLAGAGYTLTFTSGALTVAISNPFDIAVGPAAALRMLTQPGAANAGAVIPQQPVVAVEDAGGNLLLADSTTQISAAISTGTGGAVLSGTSTLTVIAGVATFTDLAINLAGTYTLEFTSTGLTPATSSAFVIASTGGGPGPTPSDATDGNVTNGCVAQGASAIWALCLLPLLWRRRKA